MKYTASLDKLAKRITYTIIIVFAIIIVSIIATIVSEPEDTKNLIFNIGSILFLSLIIFVSWYYAPKSYWVENDNLIIHRIAKDKAIKITDISDVYVMEENALNSVIRTFGVGGLFGYYGRFYAKGVGKIIFYATRRNPKVFIKMKDERQYIISPDNTKIVEEIKAKM